MIEVLMHTHARKVLEKVLPWCLRLNPRRTLEVLTWPQIGRLTNLTTYFVGGGGGAWGGSSPAMRNEIEEHKWKRKVAQFPVHYSQNPMPLYTKLTFHPR